MENKRGITVTISGELTFTIVCLSILSLTEVIAAAKVRQTMSQDTFTIAYDGPAVEGGRMDVRELAPALVAIADLFRDVNSTLNGTSATVNVNITANRAGSIEVILELIQQTASGTVYLLASDQANALVNAKVIAETILGRSGLINFLKRTKGQPIDSAQKLPDGQVRLNIEGAPHDVAETVYELSQNNSIRQSPDEFIRKPLEREGFNGFRSTYNGHTETVNKDEAAFFGMQDRVVSENQVTQWFTIVSLSFKESRKWSLDYGGSTISVAIKDEEFLRSVAEHKEYFSKDDRLHCIVHTKQTEGRDGLKTEHTVVKVLAHQQAPTQPPLLTDEPS